MQIEFDRHLNSQQFVYNQMTHHGAHCRYTRLGSNLTRTHSFENCQTMDFLPFAMSQLD